MMNDCADGNMRDRLPEYVHGTLSVAERQAVAAHVANCADCSAEVELIKAAARAIQVPTIDTGRIVRALPARAGRGPGRTSARRAQLLAAAIGIAVIGGFSAVAVHEWTRPAAAPAPGMVAAVTPAPATQAAAPAAPAAPQVVAKVDSPARAVSSPQASRDRRPAMSFGGGLSDLSDDQLDTLLGELDDLDALPSTEPETHLTPILPPADGGHGAR